MRPTRHGGTVSTMVATAAVVWTLTTASVAHGLIIKPGTTLPDGTVATGGSGGGGSTTTPDEPGRAPRAPGQPGLVIRPGVVNRTATSLALQWKDHSSTGLSPDTRHYYRVGAYNLFGETFSQPQTFGTLDGRLQVTRLQFRVRTATVTDAGTDDDVHVGVNDYNIDYGTYLDISPGTLPSRSTTLTVSHPASMRRGMWTSRPPGSRPHGVSRPSVPSRSGRRAAKCTDA